MNTDKVVTVPKEDGSDSILNEWRPHPRQELFLRSPAREILFGGARGGGKTDAGIIWVARPSIQDLSLIHISEPTRPY